MSALLEKESMSYTPAQIADLAVTLTQKNLDQIKAKSAKYRLPWKDGCQEFSLIILEKCNEFDPAKSTLCQFIFGHWEKRMRRQFGAHTFAVSCDSDDIIGTQARTLIENRTVPAADDSEEKTFRWDETAMAKMLAVARYLSGKSTTDLAQILGVTTRRVRQMLQQIRETGTIPKRLQFCIELDCGS